MSVAIVCTLLITLGTAVVAREYAGLIETNHSRGHFLSYWGFESTNAQAPVVLFLNGGPGSSSIEYGALFEMGPFGVSSDGKQLVRRNSTWAEACTLLFVDQPVGTGYSFSTKGVLDELQFDTEHAAREVAVFLSEFFSNVAPHLKAQPFFVFGESYGGHYVPQLVYELLQNPYPGVPRVQGIGLGNAWVAPLIQVEAWSKYALLHNLVDSQLAAIMNGLTARCATALAAGEIALAGAECNAVVGIVLLANPGMEIYDIRKKCPGFFDHDCYDLAPIENWLQLPSSKQRLGVAANNTWQNLETELVVESFFNGDDIASFAKLIPIILKSGTRVVAYNGMFDLLCNWIGTEHWLSLVPNSGFNGTVETAWGTNGAFGSVRQTADRSLTFVKVANSGHMAPRQQPEATLDMLVRFLKNATFS